MNLQSWTLKLQSRENIRTKRNSALLQPLICAHLLHVSKDMLFLP